MSESARAFLNRLHIHYDSIAAEVGADEVGVGLLTVLKEFDHYHYHLVRNERTEQTDLHFHLLMMGLPRIVKEILTRVPAFRVPMATFKSSPELILASLDATAGFGMIENGRRMAHAALAGECQIRELELDSFEVLLPKAMFQLEEHEQIIEKHHRQQHRQSIESGIAKTLTKRTEKHINTLLSENVYVFREHYIGYDAHPDLDDYFFGLSYLEILNRSGVDDFHHSLTFGGVTFHKYVLAQVYLLSLAMKHERFCEALVKKAPHIRLRDILTVTGDKAGFRRSLVEALNRYGPSFDGFTPVTEEEADILLKVISVGRGNLKNLDVTMAPVPPLVEFSETAWVKSAAGARIAPMEFLLNSLRSHFPTEYDRNQQTREQAMKTALRRVLSEAVPDLTFLDSIKIREAGRILTDIDFIAVERSTGSVLLFQLKHQDRYGADMRRRTNRSAKLKEETSGWLEVVRKWLQNTSAADKASVLRFPKGTVPSELRILVLTRHFAHVLADVDMQDDCAYATWMQLEDALARLRLSHQQPLSLLQVFNTLRDFMTHKVINIVTADTDDTFHVRSLAYRIRQVETQDL